MAIYRSGRRRKRRGPGAALLIAGALAIGLWWIPVRSGLLSEGDDVEARTPLPALTTDRPEVASLANPRPEVSEKGDAPITSKPAVTTPAGQRGEDLVANGKQALARGDLLAARTYFSDALQVGIEGADVALVRAELTRIGNETIFSTRTLPGDPLVGRYVLKSGDTLGKIAKAYKISADLLASINGIRDKNRIRAGRMLKVVNGPIHAVVDKSDYTLDVYVGSTMIKHFMVGLGLDDSTPTGQWRVTTKLVNPTYYAPRGGDIIAADDPKNPLGERWIGLQGIQGEAVGQLRYGIHGTIEPDSIGRSVSMGCVRLYNEDVQVLYTYLVEKYSTVTIRD